MALQQYIECMMNQYEQMFGFKLQAIVTSTFEKNDHPDVDESELLDARSIQQHPLFDLFRCMESGDDFVDLPIKLGQKFGNNAPRSYIHYSF